MNDLFTWLNNELLQRGMSNNELARRAGMSSANMSKAMTGKISITFDFCAGVARALGYPPEFVFRKAGLLPPLANPDGVKSLVDIANHLDGDDLVLLVRFARFLYQDRQLRG